MLKYRCHTTYLIYLLDDCGELIYEDKVYKHFFDEQVL